MSDSATDPPAPMQDPVSCDRCGRVRDRKRSASCLLCGAVRALRIPRRRVECVSTDPMGHYCGIHRDLAAALVCGCGSMAFRDVPAHPADPVIPQ